MKIYLILLLCWLQAASCNNSKTNNESVTQKGDSVSLSTESSELIFKAGSLTPRVNCTGDPNLSFAVYTPASFAQGKKYPVLILFDPHGDGTFPLTNYQMLADEYSYILVGSNNSKNGNNREETAHILQELVQSIYHILPIDSQRVYAGGFSGGGRVAAMLAFSPVKCQGLVTCGASFPPDAWPSIPPSVVVGIAGNADMNLIEFTTWRPIDKRLESRYQFIRFDGIHEWPAKEIFRQALMAFEAYAMKDGIRPKDEKLIRTIRTGYQDVLKNSKGTFAKIYAASTYSQWIKSLDGLDDVSLPKAAYESLMHDPIYQSMVNDDQQLFKEEDQKKNYYGKAMSNMDSTWWSREMSGLRAEEVQATPARAAMLKRVTGNLSLSIYMNLTRAISSGDLNASFFLAFLYRTVDPENSEAWYLSAGLFAKSGNFQLANQYLEKAITTGFNSRSRILSDQAFEKLSADVTFNQLLNRMTN